MMVGPERDASDAGRACKTLFAPDRSVSSKPKDNIEAQTDDDDPIPRVALAWDRREKLDARECSTRATQI